MDVTLEPPTITLTGIGDTQLMSDATLTALIGAQIEQAKSMPQSPSVSASTAVSTPTLTTLHLQNLVLSPSQLRTLFSHITQSQTTISTLIFDTFSFGPTESQSIQSINELQHFLQIDQLSCSHLESITWRNSTLISSVAQHFAEKILKCATFLKSFLLENNKITTRSMVSMIYVLLAGKIRLVQLGIAGNSATIASEEGIKALGAYLGSPFAGCLEVLSLGRNGLGVESAKALVEYLGLGPKKGLVTVNVAYNQLRFDGIDVLAEILGCIQGFKELIIHGNDLNAGDVAALKLRYKFIKYDVIDGKQPSPSLQSLQTNPCDQEDEHNTWTKSLAEAQRIRGESMVVKASLIEAFNALRNELPLPVSVGVQASVWQGGDNLEVQIESKLSQDPTKISSSSTGVTTLISLFLIVLLAGFVISMVITSNPATFDVYEYPPI